MTRTQTETRTLSVLAPAKVNLYLHITGRHDDGYHLLDSMVAFADFGDRVSLRPSGGFSFSVDGPYARAFKADEMLSGPESENLAVRAAWGLSGIVQKPLDIEIRLTKNLPVAAGIGGGSADAAAVIYSLLQWWGVEQAAVPGLDEFLLSLGADVPACMKCEAARVSGIGEKLEPFDAMGEVPIVLVHPGSRCPTVDVFARYDGSFGSAASLANRDVITFLQGQRNDLTEAALSIVPQIGGALAILERREGCLLARMSGSGATCFGLFDDEMGALDSAEKILRDHPSWWVRAGVLNRTQRY